MRRRATAVCALLLGGQALAQPADRPRISFANPTALISATYALVHPDNGQVGDALFRQAARDAILFTPEVTGARDWLKGLRKTLSLQRLSPVVSTISCDGSYGAVRGWWRAKDRDQGSFAMLWRRDEQGVYRWLVLALESGAAPVPDGAAIDEPIAGQVADCPARHHPEGRPGKGKNGERDKAPDPGAIAAPPPAEGQGASGDGSLRWQWTGGATGRFTVWARQQGQEVRIVDLPVTARLY